MTRIKGDDSMLEYVFFHEEPLRRFVAYLLDMGLSPRESASDESRLVTLDEESVDDGQADRLDDYYDERGWDIVKGIPTKQKLEDLELKDVAADLEKKGFI